MKSTRIPSLNMPPLMVVVLSAVLMASCGLYTPDTPCPATSIGITEGTASFPWPVSASALPYDGQAAFGVDSYYEVSGLDPSTQYTASLTHLTADVDLTTYTDTFAIGTPSNASIHFDCTDESAPVTATDLGAVYIMVESWTGLGGGSFTLNVQ